jgi:hypothetical protein
VRHELARVEGKIQCEEWASGYSITRILVIIIVLVTAMSMGELMSKCAMTFDKSAIAHAATITCGAFNHHLTISSSVYHG